MNKKMIKQVARMPELMHTLCIQSWRKACTPQTSQGVYSGFASYVDVSIVVLIVVGGNGSKVSNVSFRQKCGPIKSICYRW